MDQLPQNRSTDAAKQLNQTGQTGQIGQIGNAPDDALPVDDVATPLATDNTSFNTPRPSSADGSAGSSANSSASTAADRPLTPATKQGPEQMLMTDEIASLQGGKTGTVLTRAVVTVRSNSPQFILLALLALLVGIILTIQVGRPIGKATGLQMTQTVTVGNATLASQSFRDDLDEHAQWVANMARQTALDFGLPTNVPINVRLFDNKRSYQRYGQSHITGFSPAMDYCYAPDEKMIYGYWMRERSMRPRLQHEVLHALRDRSIPMPIYLEEGIAELIEGYSSSDKGPRLQTSRLRAIGRQVARGKQVLPTQSKVGRRLVYGNNGRHWYDVGYALALYYYRQDRLEGILNGVDDGALLLEDFNEFITSTGAWKRARPQTPQADWRP